MGNTDSVQEVKEIEYMYEEWMNGKGRQTVLDRLNNASNEDDYNNILEDERDNLQDKLNAINKYLEVIREDMFEIEHNLHKNDVDFYEKRSYKNKLKPMLKKGEQLYDKISNLLDELDKKKDQPIPGETYGITKYRKMRRCSKSKKVRKVRKNKNKKMVKSKKGKSRW